MLSRLLPPTARFDRETHLRILQSIHTHLSENSTIAAFQCEGAGGDLFFAMRLYKSQLTVFPRYPQAVKWVPCQKNP